MNLTFSKLYLPKYESDNHVLYRGLRLYYIFEENHLLSHYFRDGSKHFFNLSKQEIEITNTNKGLFKTSKYSIIDKQNNQTIGSINIPFSFNSSYQHYPEVPYTNPYIKICLNNIEYEFRRENSEVEYWLLNSKTWGHYKFCIYNVHKNCKVCYNFKITNPILDTSIIFNNELEGSIKVEPENYLLMFSGIFLLEHFFDIKDNSG